MSPSGIIPIIVTGCTALVYALKVYVLHCWRAEFSSNEKSTPGSVVLQLPPRDDPTVKSSVAPPAPKPDASDITMTNFCPEENGICVSYVPFPLLYAESGMDMFLGVPKTGVKSNR